MCDLCAESIPAATSEQFAVLGMSVGFVQPAGVTIAGSGIGRSVGSAVGTSVGVGAVEAAVVAAGSEGDDLNDDDADDDPSGAVGVAADPHAAKSNGVISNDVASRALRTSAVVRIAYPLSCMDPDLGPEPRLALRQRSTSTTLLVCRLRVSACRQGPVSSSARGPVLCSSVMRIAASDPRGDARTRVTGGPFARSRPTGRTRPLDQRPPGAGLPSWSRR
jgi:hypothetical protein